jgi:histidinol-phosphate phosphatase family protein
MTGFPHRTFPHYTVVVPTTGRDNLRVLLGALARADGPQPAEVIVVDDRPGPAGDLPLPAAITGPAAPIKVVRTGGRGPAAARNAGLRSARTEWIAFLDDDVVIPADWPRRLAEDLAGLGPEVGASQARIVVPLPADRRPTDDERGTAGLATARWITADMAYRRAALAEVDGFDERFPRPFREDADLALRVCEAGYLIRRGERRTTHPARRSGPLASVRAQAGNADNALMRHKHGQLWRQRTGEGPGRLGRHALTVAAAVGAACFAAAGRGRAALVAATAWGALTAGFAAGRIKAGPRTVDEVTRMALTSVLIPPAACAHRIRGEIKVRRGCRDTVWRRSIRPVRALGRPALGRPGRPRNRTERRRALEPPQALFFDRDDTLIVDVPYLADPALVRPVPGAENALRRLRDAGVRVGVVSNQSGVAKGLISHDQLAAVNARVEQLLGPFETWQVCLHGGEDGCGCRKPATGLVRQAADALGVDVRRCVVIGDTGADVAAAAAAGARGILVPTGRTRPAEIVRAHREAMVARDLTEAVELAMVGAR